MHLIRHLPRFRKAYRLLEALQERESWSRSEIETFQLERLNAVWRHAAAHVPYYRRLANARNLPPRFASLEEYRETMPMLSKTLVRANPRDFFSERPARGGWQRTGGSTYAPMDVYWEHEAHREMQRIKYRHGAMWGVDIFDRTVFVWGHGASFAPGWHGRLARLRTPVEDWLRNRVRLSAYHLSPDDLRGHLRRIEAARPAVLYGYCQAVYLLAREAESAGFRCDSLKLCVLTSETVSPRVAAKVQAVFGAPATVEYGAIECGQIASEWLDRTLRVREDVVLAETPSDEEGRCEIVLSVLNNPSFPLLRYRIEDVAEAPLEIPPRGFAVLKGVAGRKNDVLVAASGRLLHSSQFEFMIERESKSIRRYQMRQRADGALSVILDVEAGQRHDFSLLRKRMRALLEGYPVTVEIVDSFPQSDAGKHLPIVSEMALNTDVNSLQSN